MGVSTLASLQNVDLILHVLREFEDENVTHYRAKVDALRDMEIVNKEILYYVSALCFVSLECYSCPFAMFSIQYVSYGYITCISPLLYIQDLDLIEAALTDLETIKHRQFGGDYLVYQMNTLLKVCFLLFLF